MTDSRCVIVGASHAGGQLAVSLRQQGWQGPILVIGEEPYLPYNRPPLSKTFLSGQKHVDDLMIRPHTQYEKVGIEFLLGQSVTSIDREQKKVILAEGDEISYEKLALATGARVRTLDLPGSDLEGMLYLRDISDVEKIRQYIGPGKKAVIVGGGYIGLETAAMLRQLNLEVSILESAERILNRVTAPELSAFYARVHKEEGVCIESSVNITEFAGDTHVSEVRCQDGNTYPADLVIVGIGVIPNIELAEAAGLKTDNGICVDSNCLTNDLDIVAAGDCTSHFNAFYNRHLRLECVQNAMDQAKVAATTLCGKPNQYNALPWFWSDQYDLKLQIAGLSHEYDELVIRGDPESGRKMAAFYYREGKMIAVDAVNSPQEFMIGKQIIARGLTVDKGKLSDPAVAMKSLINISQSGI
ncbi:MAG: FAD/NAD(P)-binding oxidoreductase [Gammaproteobacteria bacterium]|nr:FAD/NAD(P)-binding oxidoreductase [Gammaproteobacteria bacterium]